MSAPPENPAQKPVFEKPDPQVAVRQETKKSLVWIGSVALALGLALIVLTWAVGSKTTESPAPSSNGAQTATEKTTKTRSVPSEGLITAVLGTGAALVVVGFLYGRISTIKLPGGVEVSMSKEAEKKTIEKAVAKHPNDPEKAATVAQKAQSLLLVEEPGEGTAVSPTDTEIADAVKLASQAT